MKHQLVIEVPKSALKNAGLNQIKNVLTSQIYNGVYGFMGGKHEKQSPWFLPNEFLTLH
ncbi:hypothetical protein [Helicobacter pylori]|uniref:hypothetical protein n=1 Tax=Helicobacter pylori TaxID=210 RepID=UPI001BB35417|nr:hypothetical protein [Helicobacter pylori]